MDGRRRRRPGRRIRTCGAGRDGRSQAQRDRSPDRGGDRERTDERTRARCRPHRKSRCHRRSKCGRCRESREGCRHCRKHGGGRSCPAGGSAVSKAGEQDAADARAEQHRQHHHGQVRSDLIHFFADYRALGAAEEVIVDLLELALGEAVARVVAEPRHRPLAGFGCPGLGNVGLQPGLAKTLACSIAQCGDTVGAHPEDGRDLVRVHPFHFGVPEHRLPAFGQRPECARGQRAVERYGDRVIERRRVFVVRDVIDLNVARASSPARREIADGRVEVRPERTGRAAARQDSLVDTRVGLGYEVIRIDRRGELAGNACPRAVMTAPQLCKRALIPRSRVRN